MPATKLTIPEVFDAFITYLQIPGNLCWGSFHAVLEEGNCETESVEYCIDFARRRDDTPGLVIGDILLKLTKTQRSRIGYLALQFVERGVKPSWYNDRSRP